MRTLLYTVVALFVLALYGCGDGVEQPTVLETRSCDGSHVAAEREPEDEAVTASDDEGAESELAEDWEERLVLLAPAQEAMKGWFSRLETLTLEARLVADWEGRCIELAVSSTIRLDPLVALSVGDYSPWFELETGLPLAESDHGVVMQDYLYEGRVYSTLTGLDGWGGSRWHYPLDYDDGAIQQWFGVEPSELASYGGDGDELNCVLADSGEIAEDRHEGEDVWVVTCASTIESLLPFEGDIPDSYDEALSRVLRIVISRESGAPLVSEYYVASRGRESRRNWTSRRIALTSWNEPIELPPPEPLLEGGEFGELLQQFRDRAAAPERLLDLAKRWKAERKGQSWTLEIQLESDASDGEHRTRLRESRSAEAMERTLMEREPDGDGGHVWTTGTRLLWNRDGFQVSEADVDGEPAWRSSMPDEHGFGSTTLEALLAERDWLDLDLFSDLLKLSEPEVTLPDDGETDYLVMVDSGALGPSDANFDQIASMIGRAYSELRIGDIEVLRIESFGMSIRLDAGRRQLTSHGAGGVVATDTGTFGLWFWISLDEDED
ncbi:MAG: hypothetical protein F4066_05595 [Chloroflexi bacterium]|nr:hypothetical protein [Chloroflexota bacterium]MYF82112.1 hypothetical protein [Chloroflexota bacterium]MYI04316.1 hypothetical protein [Chloroflexota bacterium]